MEFLNLASFFEHQCQIFEEYPAVITERNGRLVRLSYGRLLELSRLASAALKRQGIAGGDRVLVCADPGPERLIAHFAVVLLGAVEVPLPADVSANLCIGALDRFGARALLADRWALTAAVRKQRPRLTTVLLHRTGEPSIPTLRELLDRERTAIGRFGTSAGLKRAGDDPLVIILTVPEDPSSRAAVLTNRNYLSNVESLVLVLASTERDRILSSVPLYHPTGLLLLYFSIRNGAEIDFVEPQAQVLVNQKRKPTIFAAHSTTVLAAIHNYTRGRVGESLTRVLLRRMLLAFLRGEAIARASFANRRASFRESDWLDRVARGLAMVAMYAFGWFRRVGEIIQGFRPDGLFGRPRLLFTGGGLLDQESEYFLRGVGIPVAAGYWLTEAAGLIACRSLEFTGRRERLVAETFGPMLPHTELRLVNTRDADVTASPGTTGEVFIRGPQVMQGYYQDPDGTAEVLDERGWLRTGDHGRLTVSGELQIERRRLRSQRLKEIIK